MNIIFLTMSRIYDISRRGIYTDLLRKFRDEGHHVFVVSPRDRSLNQPTGLISTDGGFTTILGVKTLKLQKASVLEKGVGQLLVESQFKNAIKKHFKGLHFDLILYSTPPITFPNVIVYLRKKNPNAVTYLLLKDIFPQNAVDLGIMSKNGARGLIYNLFRKKEKQLYSLSDHIGCMSPANVEYVLQHNSDISPGRVEVAPNSTEIIDSEPIDRSAIRKKYGLPLNKPLFLYGGNLGKPQGIPFLISCLEANSNRTDCHFLVIGSGTELPQLKSWYEVKKPRAVTVMDGLPKDEYEELARSCDVGMIFLDHRFTIPNFPSRILSYLENKMPVLVSTDPCSDMGRIAESNGFGFWCESNSVKAFTSIVNKLLNTDFRKMGERGFDYMRANYQVDNTFQAIMKHFA